MFEVQSESISELAPALVAAQSTFDTPTKNCTAQAGNKTYRYADLASIIAAVRPHLNREGIALSQWPTVLEGGMLVMVTELVHKSGQWKRSMWPIVVGDRGSGAQAQGMGATYAKRYGLASVVAVAADDDDDAQTADGVQGKVEYGPPKMKAAPSAAPQQVAPQFAYVGPDHPLAGRQRQLKTKALEGDVSITTILADLSRKMELKPGVNPENDAKLAAYFDEADKLIVASGDK